MNQTAAQQGHVSLLDTEGSDVGDPDSDADVVPVKKAAAPAKRKLGPKAANLDDSFSSTSKPAPAKKQQKRKKIDSSDDEKPKKVRKSNLLFAQ